ncbi:MAG: acetylxylan esterase [Edaphobacter sp.]|uniref:glucuronyl esterase domain-containing protein n=1 Tax=Edaphobacter sp. TaxID=1934404 RepID=UPI0023929C87|nr:acetylxylan esterase [Edaphobacter sp.]MDE1176566.1 acetylxylan esterase [Edaphobacter sp.]
MNKLPFYASLSFACVLLSGAAASAQAPASLPRVAAGIPVNYDEDKVGTYTLPDPLVMADGKPVKDAAAWNKKRRPEILRMFETQQFGVAPGRPKAERFEVIEQGTAALDGKALRRRVDIHLNADKSAPVIHLVEYLPAHASGKVPLLLNISFSAASNTVDDPTLPVGEIWDAKTKAKVPATQGRAFGKIPVPLLLDAGFGVATFYYGDVEPDYAEGFSQGIRRFYLKKGQTERGPEDWGSIAAWAWGMSRAMDYLETDKSVDAKRVAIHGISRLGKTVMWAGAHDQRFALVIESCSGEGGTALSSRNYGETIAHLTAPSRFPYQFAENYAKWGGFPDKAPMDGHMLAALIAPRPLLLQTGDTDYWSDPKGEFLAAVAAGPVYKLLGKDALDTETWPKAKEPVLHDLGYYMHDGGHGMVAGDWEIYVRFLKMHLQPAQ